MPSPSVRPRNPRQTGAARASVRRHHIISTLAAKGATKQPLLRPNHTSRGPAIWTPCTWPPLGSSHLRQLASAAFSPHDAATVDDPFQSVLFLLLLLCPHLQPSPVQGPCPVLSFDIRSTFSPCTVVLLATPRSFNPPAAISTRRRRIDHPQYSTIAIPASILYPNLHNLTYLDTGLPDCWEPAFPVRIP